MSTPLPTEALGWRPTFERPVTLGDVPRVVANEHPDRIAVVEGARRVTHVELDQRAVAVAGALQEHGVEPGDRVAILIPNRAAFLFAYFGIAKAAAVSVPIGTRLSGSEIAFLLDHADCRALVYDNQYAAIAHELGEPRPALALVDVDVASTCRVVPKAAPPNPRADAAIFYTSGTTDDPKGVRLTHRGILHCSSVTGLAFRIEASDVELALLPMYHTATHFLALPTLMAGGTLVVHEGFRAQVAFDLLERHGVTLFPTVSATAILMAKLAASEGRDYRLDRLRMMFVGGAGVPESLLAAWRGFAPATAIANVYGLTEMGPAVSGHDPAVHPARPGSVGPPYCGIAVRIDVAEGSTPQGGIGEILVRGDSMMAGYWRNDAATAEALRDGWLHTGDLGYLDKDGFLFISGRKKHMLKRGGENVFPNEVESALIRHPAVKEALVVGVPDDVMGERVGAIVAPQPGIKLDVAELVVHCATILAEFKVPEFVGILEPELPKNSVGKIDARGLQDRVTANELRLADCRRGSVRGAELPP